MAKRSYQLVHSCNGCGGSYHNSGREAYSHRISRQHLDGLRALVSQGFTHYGDEIEKIQRERAGRGWKPA